MPPAPVAEYLLREGSGTVVHDTSGNGNDGTITGGAQAPLWVSQGLHFVTGNTNGGVLLPDTTLANDRTSITDCSLEVWVQLYDFVTNGSIINLCESDLLLETTSSQLKVSGFSFSAGYHAIGSVNTTTSPFRGEWYHIVYTRIGTALKLYVNAVVGGTGTATTAPFALAAADGGKALGELAGSNDQFDGILGEVRMYNSGLTPSDVTSLFNSTKVRYTPLPGTPIPIDGVSGFVGAEGGQFFTGPLPHGSDLYAWGLVHIPSGTSRAVYKSTDGGTTWASKDQANVGTALGASQAGSPFIDGVTRLIIPFTKSPTLCLQDFTFTTDTFTALYGTSGGPAGDAVACVKLSNGDTILIHGKTVGAFRAAAYSVFSGGVWTSIDNIVSTNITTKSIRFVIAAVDSSDRVHIVYGDDGNSLSPPMTLCYRQLAGGVLGAIHTFPAPTDFWYIGAIGIWGDKVVFPALDSGLPYLFTGTPLSAPVWTEETIPPPTTISPDASYASYFESSGTRFYYSVNNDPFGNFLNLIYFNADSGAGWSAATKVYDLLANFPPITPPVAFTDIVGLSTNSAGGIIFTTNDRDLGTVDIFLKLTSPPPPPLTLACPESALTLGAAYSAPFVATGGTPPYTFAIIAGALPPGLSLNPASGVVSGIPTDLGSFAYTGQVTDSLAETKTATCAMTVAVPGPGPRPCIVYPACDLAPELALELEPCEAPVV